MPRKTDWHIRSLEDLERAVAERRAVYVPGYVGLAGRRPAAFMLNLTGATLLRLFRAGLRTYPKKGAATDAA